MNVWTTAAAAVAIALFAKNAARAQEPQSDGEDMEDIAAVDDAVELTVGTGYARGFGELASGEANLTDLGMAGMSIQLGLGYRLIPELTLGVYGSGAIYQADEFVITDLALYSLAAGVKVDWHFLPAARNFDPWVSLGSGWRGTWIDQNGNNVTLQGFDFAKFQVGIDYRLKRTVAAGPVLGLDLSSSFWESSPGPDRFDSASNPEVNTFLFAGLLGRFDIPTKKRGSTQVASR